MKHLLDTNSLDKTEVLSIFDDAAAFLEGKQSKVLKNKLVLTLFFENSTRTRSSFEVAAKRLGAEVVHLDVAKSSTKKGETLNDTAKNLAIMGPDAIIVRHEHSGTPKLLSQMIDIPILNAGDGAHAHPTQALLDLFTIMRHFNGNVSGKKIAIVGDIKNSRVANSNISLLTKFGLEVILVAPPHFLPYTQLRTTYHLKEVIDEVDIIMSLRTQTERHDNPIYASLKDYAADYCITKELVGDRDIILLHPGPVHRNVDIDDAMMDDSRCKVLEQVKNGVAVRMAVLKKSVLG